MFRFMAPLALASFFAGTAQGDTFTETFPEYAADPEFADLVDLFEGVDFRHGDITLENGIAQLAVGDSYYFLGPQDGAYVLEQLWGNPPDDTVLGMVFPAEMTPLHDTWGMVLTYDPMGHVSDEDAEGYDYDALLSDMQAETRNESAWRVENGYETIELVGWAEPPHYDSTGRKLYWAQHLRFGGDETDTLNYNIRALGREGVLVLNVVAGMDLIDEVRAAAPDLLAMTSFTDGNRYADFDPSLDKVAAVGIGGLIAGKAVAKTGLLVVLLAFLKKGFVLLLLPLVWLRNLFTRRRTKV